MAKIRIKHDNSWVWQPGCGCGIRGPWLGYAPINLAATALLEDHIALTWENVDTKNDSIVVERSLDDITYTDIIILGSNATTYTDSIGLTDATLYYYKVKTCRRGVMGTSSTAASATTTLV